MIRITNSVFVAKPVEFTFTEFDDHTRANRWIKGLVSITPMSEPTHGVGTKWKQTYSDGSVFIEEITAYVPNERTAFKIDHEKIYQEVDIIFEPVTGGTRITLMSMMQMRWWFFKLLQPLLVAGIKKKLDQDLARFKAMAEAIS